MNPNGLPLYVPPEGDEPLDAIEHAIVRALTPIVAARIREWIAAEATAEREAKGDAPREHVESRKAS